MKSRINRWLSKNYAFCCGFELQYKNIQPKIIIEEYISELKDCLYDYRFFCFSREPYHVWVDRDSGTPRHRRKVYDIDWNEIPITITWPRLIEDIPVPNNYQLMREFAKKIKQAIQVCSYRLL